MFDTNIQKSKLFDLYITLFRNEW